MLVGGQEVSGKFLYLFPILCIPQFKEKLD